eukprot:1188116-Prorocentrum_minimum.AAC.1
MLDVPIMTGAAIVGSSMFVYKRKPNPDGSLDAYKARLVAWGHHQLYGETFTSRRPSPLAHREFQKTSDSVSKLKKNHIGAVSSSATVPLPDVGL